MRDYIERNYTPNEFKWAFDESVSSVRDLSTSYIDGETFTEIIDGFLVSPNVEIIQTKPHDLKFENSNHNPVTAEFRLK